MSRLLHFDAELATWPEFQHELEVEDGERWALMEIASSGMLGSESGTHPCENFYDIFGWVGATNNMHIPVRGYGGRPSHKSERKSAFDWIFKRDPAGYLPLGWDDVPPLSYQPPPFGDDPTMTDPLDFSAFQSAAVASMSKPRDNRLIRFFTKAKLLKFKSEQEGRAIYEDVDCVEIMVPGNRDIVTKEVTPQVKQEFEQQYTHWKQTQEQPSEGTPLSEWPPMLPAMVAMCAALNIKTVEHLAGLSDTQLQKVGMGGQEWRKKAQVWLATSSDHALPQKLSAELEALKLQNAELKQQMVQINTRWELAQAEMSSRPAQPNGADHDTSLAVKALQDQMAQLMASLKGSQNG